MHLSRAHIRGIHFNYTIKHMPKQAASTIRAASIIRATQAPVVDVLNKNYKFTYLLKILNTKQFNYKKQQRKNKIKNKIYQ